MRACHHGKQAAGWLARDTCCLLQSVSVSVSLYVFAGNDLINKPTCFLSHIQHSSSTFELTFAITGESLQRALHTGQNLFMCFSNQHHRCLTVQHSTAQCSTAQDKVQWWVECQKGKFKTWDWGKRYYNSNNPFPPISHLLLMLAPHPIMLCVVVQTALSPLEATSNDKKMTENAFLFLF